MHLLQPYALDAAAACVLSAQQPRMGMPEVSQGFQPEHLGMLELQRNIDHQTRAEGGVNDII